MSTQTVTVLESKGVIEARRLKPKIENAKRVMIETVIEIGKQYRKLDDSDKADFRRELKLSVDNALRYSLISERYLDRAKQLPPAPGAGPLEKTLSFAAEVSRPSDETFKELVRSGSITLASTSKDARRAVSSVSPLRQKLAVAARTINAASGHINAIRRLMEKEGVNEIRGPEVRMLRKEFELLCAELAAVDPATMEQAKKVLRGEV